MSKGIFKSASFCPFCGVRSLERDRSAESAEQPRYKNEFWCTSCGMGVAIGPSIRYLQATRVAKDHRSMRPPNRPPKERPADMELFTLQKYAEAINWPGQVRRATKKIGRFCFLDEQGRTHGTASYDQSMCFLRGYELAAKNEGATNG